MVPRSCLFVLFLLAVLFVECEPMSAADKISLSGNSSPSECVISQKDVAEAAGDAAWTITKKTLSAGVSAGVEVIEVDNGAMVVSILPTRGMGIWKIQAKDLRIGWDSPVRQPVHPAFVNLHSRNKLGWLDGFNELICRCGLTSNGPPGIDPDAASPIESDLTLHGRIANIPARTVTGQYVNEGGKAELVIRGVVTEATLFGQNLELTVEYRIGIGSKSITITDQVTNRAARDAELQLLYHINIGTPILEAGSRWYAPLKRLSPRDPRAAEEIQKYATYLGPTTGYAEQVYFCDPIADDSGKTLVALTDARKSRGVALQFETETLPCLAIWKNTQALADGYCTGLEPGTNYPNFKAQERREGRVVKLPPGRDWKTRMKLSILSTEEEVADRLARIESLQGDTPLELDTELVPGISGDQ